MTTAMTRAVRMSPGSSAQNEDFFGFSLAESGSVGSPGGVSSPSSG
jgi:hypothetical protein